MEIVVTIIFGILIFLLFLAVFRVVQLVFVSTQGAFYAGSNKQRIEDLIELADVQKGEKAIDLGCGDGRLVIALAKEGAEVVGAEIDAYYFLKAKRNVKKAGVEDQVELLNNNFWNLDLSEYDLIVVYGIGYIMNKLERKIKAELKSGGRVLSVHYKFPNWKEDARKGEVWLYSK